MKRFLNKKVAAVGLAAGIILGGAGAAFAYFSGSGSGTGSASTGSVAGTDLAISQTNTVSGLLPGGAAGTINLKITNNGSGSEEVGTVTGTVDSVSSGTLAGDEQCSTAFYTVAPAAVNVDLAAGASTTVSTTVKMADDNNNQDNCQAANSGGALSISYAS